MEKIAILYIATGKYTVFWNEFYTSSEQYFLSGERYKKEYFVFTDTNTLIHDKNKNVHLIHQEPLPWPYITLDRFSIFQKARTELEKMDYIYFFNRNMKFVEDISEEILPGDDKTLLMVRHPGFFDKDRSDFTYETDDKSRAYISPNEGSIYVMGGMNGGKSVQFLELIDELEFRVENDKKDDIIAIWHDESHLNRYAIDKKHEIKFLDSSYGYPEGWKLPFLPKIIIRDKTNYGGHDFLRNKNRLKTFFKRLLKW